ncbi:MAG: hypothetical protein JW917_09955 [Ignavibacteria bacterium]|nr:hypothetical protein [Ignavibacteria bacterium]
MKKIYLLFILILLSVSILGCPYKSKVAIDDYAKVKIEKKLPGTWISNDSSENKNKPYYLIKDRDGFMLDIDYYSFEDTNTYEEYEDDNNLPDNDETITLPEPAEEYKEPSGVYNVTTTYEAFLSEVGTNLYMNIRQTDDMSGFGYYIYKIYFSNNNEIILSPVTNYIKSNFSTSGELKDYINKYQNIEFFFGEDEYYIRYELPE